MTPEQWVAIAGAVSTVLGGASAAAVAWVKERRAAVVEVPTAEASAAQTITEAAKALVEPLTERVDRLESEVAELRRENSALRCDRHTLLRHIGLMEAWVSEQVPGAAGAMPTLPPGWKPID